MPVVKTNGINMAYEERGSGAPLICIMGVTAPGAVWMSEETAAHIPGSELHLYDNAGHAFHWECVNDFNPRTTEWLLKH